MDNLFVSIVLDVSKVFIESIDNCLPEFKKELSQLLSFISLHEKVIPEISRNSDTVRNFFVGNLIRFIK